MSAPAVSQAPRVLLRALPEYEPSRRTGPPGPAAAAAPLPPIAAPAPPRPPGMPTWAESGRTRARLALLVGLILEAVDGRRPLDQVRDLVVPAVYASLCTRRRQVLGRRHRLRSLHTCRPRPDTVELCATVAILRLPGTVAPGDYPKPRPFGGMGQPVDPQGFSDHFPIAMRVIEAD